MKDVLVHIDLKGLPWSLDMFFKRIKALSESGVTGIIIEWEDYFPYSGNISYLRSEHAYTQRMKSKQIVASAEHFNLEVIFLVNTLGHTEFILEHNMNLQAGSGTLDPEDTEAQNIIQEILSQVMSFHTKGTRIHIGCDGKLCTVFLFSFHVAYAVTAQSQSLCQEIEMKVA